MRVPAWRAQMKPREQWRTLEYLTKAKGNSTCKGPEAGDLQQVGISRIQIQTGNDVQGGNGEKVPETWSIIAGVSDPGDGM